MKMRATPKQAQLPAHPSLIIHHLSDVHVGRDHDTQIAPYLPAAKIASRLEQYVAYLRTADRKPDLVVVSGDLVSRGQDTAEFAEVLRLLEDMCDQLEDRPGVRMCIVPGNHDLDWSKSNYENKIRNYQVTLNKLPRRVCRVLGLRKGGSPCFTLPGTNVLVYLLNTCRLGGSFNHALHDLHQRLVDAVGESTKLTPLAMEARIDPGFVMPEDLAAMSHHLPIRHQSKLKIAVMHHNPSPMPKDWVDRFSSIVNGGIVKKRLEELGFDLLLHGHQHQANCTYEEFLVQDGISTRERDGLYVIGAPTLGARDQDGKPGWLELHLDNIDNAHIPKTPSSKISVYSAIRAPGSYKIEPLPLYRFSIGKPLFSKMRLLHEQFGRPTINIEERERTREAIEMLMSPMLSLKGQVDDWEEGTGWDEVFHRALGVYSQVFGVDRLGPSGWLNTRYLSYLCQQFRHCAGDVVVPNRCSEIRAAINRTHWDRESSNIPKRAVGAPKLEVARILLWTSEQCSEQFAINTLRMIDVLHRLFAVPVFVLDATAAGLPSAHLNEEFVLGIDPRNQEHSVTCYVFNVRENGPTRLASNGSRYFKRFKSFLNHPNLQTINQFIKGLKVQRVTVTRSPK